MNDLKKSTKNLESARECYQLTVDSYMEGHRAKAEGRPVAWVMYGFPTEILYAMDITPVYPENYAAMCAAKRVGSTYCEAAEQDGFSKQLCSYTRTVNGYFLHQDAFPDPPAGGLPSPDLLLATTVVCDIRQKWFEDLSRRLNIPVYIGGVPDNASTWGGERPAQHLLDYCVAEYKGIVSFLEEFLNRKLDHSRLEQAVHWGNEAWDARLGILEARKNRPAPMSSSDYFATIYPGLGGLGTKIAADFYKKQLAEVQERVRQNISVIPEEKFRLMWSGIPIWYNLGLLNYPEPYGGVMAIEGTYQAFPRLRAPEDPYVDLALRYFGSHVSIGIDSQVNLALKQVEEYAIDGVILSYTQSCRPFYLYQAESRNYLKEKLDIPTLMLESDMADERSFSEGQIRTRMDAFLELILKRKGLA